jgi:hypothetical protein
MKTQTVFRTGMALVLILALARAPESSSTAITRRVNAPYFAGPVDMSQTAIFWFGKITSYDNYTDVRVGYNTQELYVHVAIFDRLLWYDPSPSPADLMSFDSVALYLNRTGNIGAAPTNAAYRFDTQLNDQEPRADWQATYRGNGSGWAAAALPFTTVTGIFWNTGDEGGINNGQNNRGWFMTFHIPFASLGVSGAPPPGATWGLAVLMHDRDDQAGTVVSTQTWPEVMNAGQPGTWGQLGFGLPAYTPPRATPGGSILIRHGLNGAVVADGHVGGSVSCGAGLDLWTQWGAENYAGATELNIQNQANLPDWPCFSKMYITFPLNSIPAGKAILSATLNLQQFGGSGEPNYESLVHVMTVGNDWNEATVNWNNAPLAIENVAANWVYPVNVYPNVPGITRTWDVSRAVAEAYAQSQPLRLALYEADWAMNSGKYFWSSDVDDGMPQARPALTVIWGNPAPTLNKQVSPSTALNGQTVTYTLNWIGTGQPLTMTDSLPAQVSAPGPLLVQGGGSAGYNAGNRLVSWTGTPASGQAITLTFPVTVQVSAPAALVNTAILTAALTSASQTTATLIANPYRVWQPIILR